MPSEPDRVAFIQHSAGTTGLQKGVALSHAAVLRQLGHLTTALNVTDDDRIYSWLPLYHDMGLIACFMLPLTRHVPLVMQSPTTWVTQPGAMMQLIGDYRCTLAWMPNFALQFLARRVRAADRAELTSSSLRALINCSEPVRARVSTSSRARTRRAECAPTWSRRLTRWQKTSSPSRSRTSIPSPRRLYVDRAQLSQRRAAMTVNPDDRNRLCLVSSGRCLDGQHVRVVDAGGADCGVPASAKS